MAGLQCGFTEDSADAQDALVRQGPMLREEVGFDRSYDPRWPAFVPDLQVRGAPALIDTGASTSGVDATLASHLCLAEIDELEIATANGVQTVPRVLVQIHVPALSFTLYGPLVSLDLTGGDGAQVVLGRDFLRSFSFVYDGPTGTALLHDPAAPQPIMDFPDG